MTAKERDGLFRVCVDGGPGGRVFSRRVREPFSFADLGDLLLKIERLLEVQDYPQAFQAIRTFRPDREKAERTTQLPPDGMPLEAVEGARGERLTFDLQITTRRNATWQGFVHWGDGTKTAFENDLGFLSIVARALEQ